MLLQAVGNNRAEPSRAAVGQLLRTSSCSLSSQPGPPNRWLGFSGWSGVSRGPSAPLD